MRLPFPPEAPPPLGSSPSGLQLVLPPSGCDSGPLPGGCLGLAWALRPGSPVLEAWAGGTAGGRGERWEEHSEPCLGSEALEGRWDALQGPGTWDTLSKQLSNQRH